MESTPKNYKVVLERKVEKQLKSLPKADYLKLRTAIDKLAEIHEDIMRLSLPTATTNIGFA